MAAFRGYVIGALATVALTPTNLLAAPSPTYSRTVGDCTTNQNQVSGLDGKQYWSVSSGCDNYQNEVYERPTAQTFQVAGVTGGQVFGAQEYFQNLDIKQVKVGRDNEFLYVAIEMVGGGRITSDGKLTYEGLAYEYNFILSNAADGAFGYLLRADQPAFANGGTAGLPNTTFTPLKALGNQDTNGDVGGSGMQNGLSITKQDNLAASMGNGFDLSRIGDGTILNGPNTGAVVLFSRVNRNNFNEVEFALDYTKLGFTGGQIDAIIAGNGYFDFRAIKGGPKDPQNYLWNDEYTRSEAGSPYRCGTTPIACNDFSKSEFGTQGLGNIYELDNLRLGVAAVPEPGSWALMIFGFGLIGVVSRRRSPNRPYAAMPATL